MTSLLYIQSLWVTIEAPPQGWLGGAQEGWCLQFASWFLRSVSWSSQGGWSLLPIGARESWKLVLPVDVIF
jgi:hypothetical protein